MPNAQPPSTSPAASPLGSSLYQELLQDFVPLVRRPIDRPLRAPPPPPASRTASAPTSFERIHPRLLARVGRGQPPQQASPAELLRNGTHFYLCPNKIDDGLTSSPGSTRRRNPGTTSSEASPSYRDPVLVMTNAPPPRPTRNLVTSSHAVSDRACSLLTQWTVRFLSHDGAWRSRPHLLAALISRQSFRRRSKFLKRPMLFQESRPYPGREQSWTEVPDPRLELLSIFPPLSNLQSSDGSRRCPRVLLPRQPPRRSHQPSLATAPPLLHLDDVTTSLDLHRPPQPRPARQIEVRDRRDGIGSVLLVALPTPHPVRRRFQGRQKNRACG